MHIQIRSYRSVAADGETQRYLQHGKGRHGQRGRPADVPGENSEARPLLVVDGEGQSSCVSFVEETAVPLGSPTESARCYFEMPAEVVMRDSQYFEIAQDCGGVQLWSAFGRCVVQ